MHRARWRTCLDPHPLVVGVILLLTAIMPFGPLGPATLAASDGQATGEPACPTAVGIALAASRDSGAAGAMSVSDVVSAAGELTGRTLDLDGEGGSAPLSLPVESFVGQAVGDLLVYTAYAPASGSTVHLVDLASGCDVIAARPAEIVRSALIDAAAAVLYAHTVTLSGRADNGVARIDIATGAVASVVPPLPASDAFGPTFGTQLAWSLDGAALAVQSCGFEACRTRVLDPAGDVRTYGQPDQGAMIGLTDDHLVTFAACAGLPCDVLGIDLASGGQLVLADAAWSATLRVGPSGEPVLSATTSAGSMEIAQ